MLLFLGIDGGGTRTQACLGDERGHILAMAVAGPSNPTKVTPAAARKEILQAAREVLRKASVAEVTQQGSSPRRSYKPMLTAVCAGVSGVDPPAVNRPLLTWLRKAIPARHHMLTTDAAIALRAGLGTSAGMIVISGTGSIGYARDHRGERLRVGGWGAAFDDLGSGYDVGHKAIRAALRDFEGTGERTVLTSKICRALKLSNIAQITQKQTQLEIKEVAALSAVVSEAAREGDRVARRLCADAGADLADIALALAKRLGHPETLPIVCAGGFFQSSPTLRRSFARHVHERLPSAHIRLMRREPVEGALAMARNLAA